MDVSNISFFKSGLFEKEEKIAAGTYGVLYKGKSEGISYAIKQFKVEKAINFVASLKELDFLSRLNKHPLILRLIGVCRDNPFNNYPNLSAGNSEYVDDRLYMIFEMASYDGKTFLSDNVSYDYLKISMLQTLLALEYMHGHGIMHRDLKPNNLLWFRHQNDRAMKVCDFGISKIYCKNDYNSHEVVTPLYRAPELLFRWNDYDLKSDIWSLGCVFYELCMKDSFINTEKVDPDELLRLILSKTTEIPTIELFNHMNKKGLAKFNTSCLSKNQRLNELVRKKIKESEFNLNFGKLDQFTDLLEKMLVVNPDKRLDATECLNHDFFAPFKTHINEMRVLYPPFNIDYFNPIINMIVRKERQYAVELAISFHNNRIIQQGSIMHNRYPWYQHRIIFQSLDLFDRFLSIYTKDLDENIAKIYYITCLYISIKYFLTLPTPCNFNSLLPDNLSKITNVNKIAEDFEWYLISVCLKYNIYRPTLFETADFFGIKLTDTEVATLLSGFCTYYVNDAKLFDYFCHILPKSNIEIPNVYKNVSLVSNVIKVEKNVINNVNKDSPKQENMPVSDGTIGNGGNNNTRNGNGGNNIVETMGPHKNFGGITQTGVAIHTYQPGEQTTRGFNEKNINNKYH
jgi:serine/threonine protein kinase